jgi:hypothetical protein
MLALTSPRSGGRLVNIDRSRTQATDLFTKPHGIACQTASIIALPGENQVLYNAPTSQKLLEVWQCCDIIQYLTEFQIPSLLKFGIAQSVQKLQASRTGFSPRKRKIFIISTESKPILGTTEPPLQWILEYLSPGSKAP